MEDGFQSVISMLQTGSDAIFNSHPVVKAETTTTDDEEEDYHSNKQMSDLTAVGLLTAQFGFIFVHTSTYVITEQFWNRMNPLFILAWFFEEVPNFFAMLLCFAAIFDKMVPNTLRVDKAQLQKAIYYWKPVVELIAWTMLLVPITAFIFGSVIWYKADGEMDNQIGQSTMMQALMVLLPYISSLIVHEVVLDYTKVDLGLAFAENPLSFDKTPTVQMGSQF